MDDVWSLVWRQYFSLHVLPLIPRVGVWRGTRLSVDSERDAVAEELFRVVDEWHMWEELRDGPCHPFHTLPLFDAVVVRAGVMKRHVARSVFYDLYCISHHGWLGYAARRARREGRWSGKGAMEAAVAFLVLGVVGLAFWCVPTTSNDHGLAPDSSCVRS